MENKQINPVNSIDNLSDKYLNAASSTDCTGLIPSDPKSYDELESYKEVYNYQVPVEGDDENNNKKKK